MCLEIQQVEIVFKIKKMLLNYMKQNNSLINKSVK